MPESAIAEAPRLPPGSRLPGTVQGLAMLAARRATGAAMRRRYGASYLMHIAPFGNVVVVAPAGRADLTGSAALESALAPLWARADVSGLVLDFAGVPYISSVGLRVLMIASKALRARGARIAVAAMQPVVAEILEICRFNAVVEVFPAVDAALDAMSPAANASRAGATKAP